MLSKDNREKIISLQAREISYKITIFILSLWTIYNCWQTLYNGEKYNPFPGFIVCIAIFAESLAKMLIKNKTASGDEDNKPHAIKWYAVLAVVFFIVLLLAGTYFLIMS